MAYQAIQFLDENKNAINVSDDYPLPVALSGGIGGLDVSQDEPNPDLSKGWPVKLTDGVDIALITAAGAVVVDGSASTQPVSGTVTVNGAVSVSNFPATQPVSGSVSVSNFPATQPVSAASLPLPTGAATETTLAAMSAKLPALGQATMASSQPVVIASNQTAIPVTTTTTDVTASGTITTQNLVPAGTATANSAVLSGALNGAATGCVQVTGTYTGALSLQITIDGSAWITVGGTPFQNVNTGALSATIVSGTQGIFQFDVTGSNQYRVTGLAAMTGTATVSLRTSRAAAMVTVDAALPTGANSIGAVTQGGTWTVLPGNTANTTAWLVAARTNDGTGNSVTSNLVGVQRGLDISQIGRSVTFRFRQDYSVTPVTTAAYTQVISSTAAVVREIEIFDSSGQTLVLATGAAASEVDLVYVFPGGNGRIPVYVAGGVRISVKAISATANVGEIIINAYA